MANVSPFKILYRMLTWTSLAGLIIILVLVLRKAPPPDIPNDPKAAARVEEKFAAADQAKAEGQPAQVQLDRAELNSYVQQSVELSSQTAVAPPQTTNPASANSNAAPSNNPLSGINGAEQPTLEQVQSSVKDVKVDMDGDLVKAYVIFDFHGKDMSLELDGHLRAENGYLKFDPVAGKLGDLPLPQSVLNEAVEKMMASPQNRQKLRLPDDISDLQIQNGQAVVTYK